MKLFETAKEAFLFQANASPTRFREGNNPPVLDLAFTKYPDEVPPEEILAPLGISDFVEVLLELQFQLQEDKQLSSFSWSYQKQEDRNSLSRPRRSTGAKSRH